MTLKKYKILFELGFNINNKFFSKLLKLKGLNDISKQDAHNMRSDLEEKDNISNDFKISLFLKKPKKQHENI